MSTEARLDKLEAQHRSLDAQVHGLARVCADIKNIALTNQHDIARVEAIALKNQDNIARVEAIALKNQDNIARVETIALKNQHDIAGIKAAIAALTEATHAGFKRVDEMFAEHSARFDQLELLIRQLIPKN